MAAVTYDISGREGAWRIGEGEASIRFDSRLAAFEAAVAGASDAIRAGHDVVITVMAEAPPAEPPRQPVPQFG